MVRAMVLVERGLLLCLFLLFQASVEAASCAEDPLSVVVLLPLGEEYPFGEALLGGFIAGDQAPLEHSCAINLRYLDTKNESLSFYSQWLEVLAMEPDLLVGPLLPEHQQQLSEMPTLELPQNTTWWYPGDPALISVQEEVSLYGFSVSWHGQLHALMEYGWDQGQHDLVLLLPDSDLGHQIAERVALQWGDKGGEVAAVVHYGAPFSALNQAVRELVRLSRGQFDALLVLADDQRLQMLPSLMRYHAREEPIYSLTPPVGVSVPDKDLDGLLYPMQPALLQRSFQSFDVDDYLLEVENIGFDLMALLRAGVWSAMVEKRGSYLGRSGRYRLEGRQLLRTPCFVKGEKGRQVIEFCPSAEAVDGTL